MSFFTNLIFKYGIFAMFFIILIEYACFPISSEIVLPFSGAVASIQHINFLTILPLSVIAGIIGTSFCYFVGRTGGGALLDKIMRKFPKSRKGITASMDKFQRFGNLAVCFGRLIPLIRTYIAFVAGAAKQSYPSFFFSSLIGITIWNTILIGLGYILREKWDIVSQYYVKYKEIILPLLLFITLFIIVKARRRK